MANDYYFVVKNGLLVGQNTGNGTDIAEFDGSVTAHGNFVSEGIITSERTNYAKVVLNSTAQTSDTWIIENSNGSLVFTESHSGSTVGSHMYIEPGGNVGINTSNPVHELDVAGQIWARGNTAGTDDVLYLGTFDTNYNSPYAVIKIDDPNSDSLITRINRWGSTHRFSRNSQAGSDISVAEFNSSNGQSRLSVYNQNDQVNSTAVSENVRLHTAGKSWLTGGNVGVGTTDPLQNLHVYAASSNANVRITGDGQTASYMDLYHGGTEYGIWSNESSNRFRIGTASAERLTITASGNVGIGKSNPNYELVVASTGSADVQILAGTTTSESNVLFGDSGAAGQGRVQYVHTDDRLSLWANGSARVTIASDGDVGIGTTNPDYDLHVRRSGVASIVSQSTDNAARVETMANGGHQASFDSRNGNLHARYILDNDNLFRIYNQTAGSDVFTVTSAGNVGIATLTPGFKLDVAGNVRLGSPSGSSVVEIADISGANYRLETGGFDLTFKKYDADATTWVTGLQITGNDANDGAPNVYIPNDLTIGGDITVQGTTTTVNTTNLEVTDAIIKLNHGQSTPANDIGIVFQRYASPTATNYNVGFVWEEGTDRLVFGKTPELGSDNDLTFNTEWFTITSDGNVGIGTTDPQTQLHISDPTTGGDGLLITGASGNEVARLEAVSGFTNRAQLLLKEGTGNSVRVRFTSQASTHNYILDNRLGLGTSSPDSVFHVVSDEIGNGANRGIKLSNYNETQEYSIRTGLTGVNNTTLAIYDETAGENRIVISTDGKVGIGTTNPGRKLDVAGGIQLSVADTNLNTLHAGIRRGNSGEMYLDAPGHIIATIDTNNNNTDRYFGIRKDTGTELMRVTEAGRLGLNHAAPSVALDVRTNEDPADGTIVFLRNNTAAGNGAFIRYDVNNVGDWAIGIPDNQNAFTIWKDQGNSGTEMVRVASDGDVGIGTNNPTANLDVYDAVSTDLNDFHLKVRNNTSSVTNYMGIAPAQIRYYRNTNTSVPFTFASSVVTGSEGGGDFVFSPNHNSTNHTPIERMRIKKNGRVGIGTSSPGAQLDIRTADTASLVDALHLDNPNASGNGVAIAFLQDNGVKHRIKSYYNGTTQWNIGFDTEDTTNALTINDNGNVGIGTTNASALLHAYKNDNRNTIVLQNNNHIAGFDTYGTATSIYTNASNGFFFRQGTSTNYTNYMHVDNGGNIGIGVDNPSAKLHVHNGVVYSNYGFSSDNNAKTYTWRAVNNMITSYGWVKIARITGSQSTRFMITLTGRYSSYGDGEYGAKTEIYGQLNNDNNYDISYVRYAPSGTAAPENGVLQVDVNTSSTDLYIYVSTFGEVAAHGLISDGSITVDSTFTGSDTKPTGYVDATLRELNATTLDGLDSTVFVRKDGVNNGSTDIRVDDADFIVRDTTDPTTNFIWRDHSASKLYLGTSAAVTNFRSNIEANGDGLYNIGSDSTRFKNIRAGTTSGGYIYRGWKVGSGYSDATAIYGAVFDNANGAQSYFFDGYSGGTSGTKRFYVRADGQGYFAANVGAGTDAPVARFHAYGSGGTVRALIQAADGNQASVDLKNSEGEYRIISDSGELRFYDQTGGYQAGKISTAGDLDWNYSIVGPGTGNRHLTNVIANAATEEGHFAHPYLNNAWGHFVERGGTVTYSGYNNPPGASSSARMFYSNSKNLGFYQSNMTGSTFDIIMTDVPNGLSYGSYGSITFGNSSWAATSVTVSISTDNGSTWTQIYTSSSTRTNHWWYWSTGATGTNAMKITLGTPSNGNYMRINNITAYNYSSEGTEQYFLPRRGGTLYGDGDRTLAITLESSPSTGNVGTQLRAGSGDYLGLAAGGGTGVGIVVDSSNRVGIGTTGPTSELHVYNSGYSSIQISSARTGATDNIGGLDFLDSSNTIKTQIVSTVQGDIKLFSGGQNERMRVRSDGNVGVGTTASDAARLQVYDSLSQGSGTLWLQTAKGSIVSHVHHGANADWYIRSGVSAGSVFIQDTNSGTVRIGSSTPNTAKLNVNSAAQYGALFQHSLAATAGGSNTIFAVNTNASSTFGASIGFSANSSDGQHHRAVIYATRDGGTNAAGKLQFVTRANGGAYNTHMTIKSVGNIGIGADPSWDAKLTVKGDDTSPDFESATVSDISLYVTNSDTDYGTMFGTYGTGVGVIQQRRRATTTAYDLALNPFGGNVGIGTSAPSDGNTFSTTPKLHVYNNTSGTNPSIVVSGNDQDEASLILGENSSNLGYAARLYYEGSGNNFFNISIADTSVETHALTIDRYTNVGIGTTGPEGRKLYLKETGASTANTTKTLLTLDHSPSTTPAAGFGSEIEFRGKNPGNGTSVYGSIAAVWEGTTTNPSGGTLQFKTDGYSGGNTTRMTIDSSGDVGIGTITPDAKLHVYGAGSDGQEVLRIDSTGDVADGGYHWMTSAIAGSQTTNANIVHLIGQAESAKNSGYLGFHYAGAASNNNFVSLGGYAANHLLNVMMDGRVGIGTSSPDAVMLTIRGNATRPDPSVRLIPHSTSDVRIDFRNSGNAAQYYFGWDQSAGQMKLADSAGFGTPIMTWDTSERVGINTGTMNAALTIVNTTTQPTLTVNSTQSSWDASIVIGNTTISNTLLDTNDRPTLVLDGSYPVINLNSSANANANHGPTIQFTNDGHDTNRQWVMGSPGTGRYFDIGTSGGSAGTNSDWNPHNGISGYAGKTVMRFFEDGAVIGDTGAYNSHVTSINSGTALDIRSVLEFTSPDATNQIKVSMTDADVLSFIGDAGQLFSLSDSLTGTIFSVNDVSGVPSIEVDDDGTIRLAETFGNVLIGTATDDGTNKLQVTGDIAVTGDIIDGGDSNRIRFMYGTTNSQPSIGVGEQGLYGFAMRWDSGSELDFDGWWGSSVTGAANRDLGSVNVNTRVWNFHNTVQVNGNTVWHTGNDGSGSGLDADTVDGIQGASFLRSDANDTATGQIFFDAGFDAHPIMLNGAQNFDNIDRSGFYNLYNTQTSSTNSPSMDYGTMIVVGNDKQSQGFGLQLAHERLNNGMFVRGMNDTASAWSSWQRIFMDNYHPNADTWTTARTNTVTLTGDATGSASSSVNGSANWTNSIAVNVNRIDGQEFVNTRSNSGRAANTTDGNGIYYYTSNVDNFSGNSTDGAMYQQSYSSSWIHQIAADYRSGNIALRGKNNNSWQRWKKVPTIYTSDTAPTTALVNDDFWFDSDEGKLKIRYNGVWMDTFTLGTSGFVQKTGDTMTGALTISTIVGNASGTLNVTGDIVATGDVTAYSDITLKSDVKTIEGALDKVTSMRGVTYEKDGRTGTGVIAQEMEQVLPEVVHTDEDSGLKSVAYGNIVGTLIEAMKEQQEQINALKAEIEKLKGE